MNALMWNRDLALSAHETRRLERAEGMTEKGRGAAPSASRICGRASRARLRDRHRAQEPRSEQRHRLSHPRDRLRPRPGAARLLPGARAPGDHPPHPHRPDLAPGSRPGTPTRPTAPFGFVLLMEGADPIVEPDQARLWWDDGLRIGQAGPLRPQRLRLWHRQRRAADRAGARAAAADGRSWG